MNSLWKGLVSNARTEKPNNVTTLRDLWIQTDQCLGFEKEHTIVISRTTLSVGCVYTALELYRYRLILFFISLSHIMKMWTLYSK